MNGLGLGPRPSIYIEIEALYIRVCFRSRSTPVRLKGGVLGDCF